jgi:hypothetical protein
VRDRWHFRLNQHRLASYPRRAIITTAIYSCPSARAALAPALLAPGICVSVGGLFHFKPSVQFGRLGAARARCRAIVTTVSHVYFGRQRLLRPPNMDLLSSRHSSSAGGYFCVRYVRVEAAPAFASSVVADNFDYGCLTLRLVQQKLDTEFKAVAPQSTATPAHAALRRQHDYEFVRQFRVTTMRVG